MQHYQPYRPQSAASSSRPYQRPPSLSPPSMAFQNPYRNAIPRHGPSYSSSSPQLARFSPYYERRTSMGTSASAPGLTLPAPVVAGQSTSASSSSSGPTTPTSSEHSLPDRYHRRRSQIRSDISIGLDKHEAKSDDSKLFMDDTVDSKDATDSKPVKGAKVSSAKVAPSPAPAAPVPAAPATITMTSTRESAGDANARAGASAAFKSGSTSTPSTPKRSLYKNPSKSHSTPALSKELRPAPSSSKVDVQKPRSKKHPNPTLVLPSDVRRHSVASVSALTPTSPSSAKSPHSRSASASSVPNSILKNANHQQNDIQSPDSQIIKNYAAHQRQKLKHSPQPSRSQSSQHLAVPSRSSQQSQPSKSSSRDSVTHFSHHPSQSTSSSTSASRPVDSNSSSGSTEQQHLQQQQQSYGQSRPPAGSIAAVKLEKASPSAPTSAPLPSPVPSPSPVPEEPVVETKKQSRLGKFKKALSFGSSSRRASEPIQQYQYQPPLSAGASARKKSFGAGSIRSVFVSPSAPMADVDSRSMMSAKSNMSSVSFSSIKRMGKNLFKSSKKDADADSKKGSPPPPPPFAPTVELDNDSRASTPTSATIPAAKNLSGRSAKPVLSYSAAEGESYSPSPSPEAPLSRPVYGNNTGGSHSTSSAAMRAFTTSLPVPTPPASTTASPPPNTAPAITLEAPPSPPPSTVSSTADSNQLQVDALPSLTGSVVSSSNSDDELYWDQQRNSLDRYPQIEEEIGDDGELTSGGDTVFPKKLDLLAVETIRSSLERTKSLERRRSKRSTRSNKSAASEKKEESDSDKETVPNPTEVHVHDEDLVNKDPLPVVESTAPKSILKSSKEALEPNSNDSNHNVQGEEEVPAPALDFDLSSDLDLDFNFEKVMEKERSESPNLQIQYQYMPTQYEDVNRPSSRRSSLTARRRSSSSIDRHSPSPSMQQQQFHLHPLYQKRLSQFVPSHNRANTSSTVSTSSSASTSHFQTSRPSSRNTGGQKSTVTFSSRIVIYDTYDRNDYDRRAELATCNRLTPMLAQQIKEEINNFKMEMDIHADSRIYTHFI